jgi:hypothetical protein
VELLPRQVGTIAPVVLFRAGGNWKPLFFTVFYLLWVIEALWLPSVYCTLGVYHLNVTPHFLIL